jgi:hypothetical protein
MEFFRVTAVQTPKAYIHFPWSQHQTKVGDQLNAPTVLTPAKWVSVHTEPQIVWELEPIWTLSSQKPLFALPVMSSVRTSQETLRHHKEGAVDAGNWTQTAQFLDRRYIH